MDHLTMDKTLLEAFARYIHQHTADFHSHEAPSVLELLYIAYTESREKDPEEIQQGFLELDTCLEKFNYDDHMEIFALACRLSSAYEQRAFIDGLQFGAHLMLELQNT